LEIAFKVVSLVADYLLAVDADHPASAISLEGSIFFERRPTRSLPA
jgi:hypothetical protein